MFKIGAGLGSLGIAFATLAVAASAAPPDGGTTQANAPVADDLPNPEEAKRRELREAALKQVIAGRATVRDITGSKVVKLGKAAAEPGAAAEDQYVELAREKTDKILSLIHI